MEVERPDFEFDEFFFDDEEETPAQEETFEAEEKVQPQAQMTPEPVIGAVPAPDAAQVRPERKSPEPEIRAEVPQNASLQKEDAALERFVGGTTNLPQSEPEAPRRGVRVQGKVTRRVDTQSILPQICERVDDIIMYMYQEGLLKDEPQPAAQQMPATGSTMPLNAVRTPQPGASYVLVDALTSQMISIDGNLRIGRDPSYADLVPPGNNTVSAQHAELTVKQNVLIVRDIGQGGEGTLNGTRINGVRIPERSHFGVEAREGDILEFSDAKYKVEKL